MGRRLPRWIGVETNDGGRRQKTPPAAMMAQRSSVREVSGLALRLWGTGGNGVRALGEELVDLRIKGGKHFAGRSLTVHDADHLARPDLGYGVPGRGDREWDAGLHRIDEDVGVLDLGVGTDEGVGLADRAQNRDEEAGLRDDGLPFRAGGELHELPGRFRVLGCGADRQTS